VDVGGFPEVQHELVTPHARVFADLHLLQLPIRRPIVGCLGGTLARVASGNVGVIGCFVFVRNIGEPGQDIARLGQRHRIQGRVRLERPQGFLQAPLVHQGEDLARGGHIVSLSGRAGLGERDLPQQQRQCACQETAPCDHGEMFKRWANHTALR